jgi:hypothetical protein
MAISNVSGPTALDCGAYVWRVNFTLPTASLAGGYFVQDLRVRRTATDCKGNADPDASMSQHYWEAWHVKPGDTQDELVTDGTFTYSDQFSLHDIGASTKGSFESTASVRFYEGLSLPASFVANNPDTIAGDLPSTATDPGLKGGTPALKHEIRGSWDCCPSAKATKITGHTP